MALKRLILSALALAMLGTTPAAAQTVHARVRARPPARAAAERECGDGCLKGFASDYMDALAAQDPGRLEFAPDVRFTENTRPLKLGDGLWGTVTAVGSYRHYFTDPVTGEVGLFSTVEEQGVPALFVLRLKVQNFKIGEVETIVVRKQDMGSFLNTNRLPKPIWEGVTPPEERISRDALVKVADSYFDALVQGSGDAAPFDDDCVRVENGVQTVHNPSAKPAPDARDGFNPGAMTCKDQIDTKIFSYISRIEPRRYLVVDEPHQSVLAIVMFHHNGRTTSVETPNNGTYHMPAAALRPFDVVIGEAFRIKDGKIREVEAVMTSLPYGSDLGWEKR